MHTIVIDVRIICILMAKNKGAIIRYRAIDQCLRDRKKKYGWKELADACSSALERAFSQPESVSRRQIYADLNYMESDAGYQADIDHIRDGHKVYFRYTDPDFSIEKMPLNDAEIEQLKETVLMLNRFKGMPHFEWMEEILSKIEDTFMLKGNSESVIGFEQNLYLKGLEHITPLFDAIIHKRVLSVQYKSFKAAHSTEHELHPYFLKQYNNRWFLFGLTTERHQITNFALDRIETISILDIDYIEKSDDLDFEEYFDDIIGVTLPRNQQMEEVILCFSEDRYPYVKNKPIHHSQRCYDAERKIVIKVIPNKELIALLLSYGNQVEVVQPQSVRDMIKQHICTMLKFYE